MRLWLLARLMAESLEPLLFSSLFVPTDFASSAFIGEEYEYLASSS